MVVEELLALSTIEVKPNHLAVKFNFELSESEESSLEENPEAVLSYLSSRFGDLSGIRVTVHSRSALERSESV